MPTVQSRLAENEILNDFQSSSFFGKTKTLFASFFRKAQDKARDIGISVSQTVYEMMNAVFLFISNLYPQFTNFMSSLRDMLYSSANYIITNLENVLKYLDPNHYKNTILAYVCLVLILITVSLPSHSITMKGRFLLAIMTGVIYYSKSLKLTIATGLFLTILSKMAPLANLNLTVNNNQATHELQWDEKEVREDAKALILNVISVSILFSAASTGIDFPTDDKSWEKLMKRHVLLHRSFQAWEFGASKVVELFESSARIVCKYVYGTEYTSMTFIQEIESLIMEVIELTTLENQFNIGKDEELSLKIECLYTQFLQLKKIYANDAKASNRLNVVAGPLTAYYRRVTNKNPRANAMRKEPVVIAIKGGTGLGKTYLATAFQQDLLKICGRYNKSENLSGQIYARNIEQEFWDGYTGQPIVVFDDFGQHVDCVNNPNEEFFEVIRAANIFPYMLHSAELAEKANNPFKAEFIYLTTNDEAFKPVSIISKEAFQRRIHIDVTMHVTEEVATYEDAAGTRSTQAKLDKIKLRRYKEENGLDEADFSHIYFKDARGKVYSYEELICAIGEQYRINVEEFKGRQKMAEIKKEQKLPQNCFSLDPQWRLESETVRMTSATFFNQPRHLQKIFIQRGYSIYNSRTHCLGTCDDLEEFLKKVNDLPMPQHIQNRAKIVPMRVLSSLIFGKPPLGENLELELRTRHRDFLARDFPALPLDAADHVEEVEEFFESGADLGDLHTDDADYWNDLYENVSPGTYYSMYMAAKAASWYAKLVKALGQRTFNGLLWFIRVLLGALSIYSMTKLFVNMVNEQGNYSTKDLAERPLWNFYKRMTAGTEISALLLAAIYIGPENMYDKQHYIHVAMPFIVDGLWYVQSSGIALYLKQVLTHFFIHPKDLSECNICRQTSRLRECSLDDGNDEPLDKIKSDTLAQLEMMQQSDKMIPITDEQILSKLQSPTRHQQRPTSKLEFQPESPHPHPQRNAAKLEVNITPISADHQPTFDTELESPNKVQTSKKSKLEDDTESIIELTESQEMESLQLNLEPEIVIDPIIKKIFNLESGRSLDGDRKKKSNLEGLISEQADLLATKGMGNFWKLSVVKDGEITNIGNVFVIKGRKCLINIHFIEAIGNHYKCDNRIQLHFRQHGKEAGLKTDLSCLLNAKPIFRGLDQTEFMLITLPKEFPNAPDFSKHLIKTSDLSKLRQGVRCLLARPDESGTKLSFKTKEGSFLKFTTTVVPDLTDDSKTHTYARAAMYDIATTNGDCGSPIFLNSNMFEKKLLGFHYSGMEGTGSCSVMCFDDLKDLLREELCSSDSKLSKLQCDNEIFPNLSCRIKGYVENAITHPCATTLRQSLIFECLGPAEMAPAVLEPPLREGGPMLKGFMKYSLQQTRRLDRIYRDASVRDYFQTNIASKRVYGWERSILTYEEACMGVEGNSFLAPLKRSKSSGYPYMLTQKKGKEGFFGKDVWDFKSADCVELFKDCQRIEEQAKHGIVPEVIFVATLKDEKRVLAKIESKSTRVFSASPLHFTIVFRKYFAGFFAFIMRNKITNESAVGTNVHSTDWKEIVQHLKCSDYFQLLAGDFKNFDGDLLVDIMEDILTIVNDYYADNNTMIRRCLWECITHSKQLIYDILIELFNGQPSGNPGTAIINSIYVSLLFRNAFYQLRRSISIPFSSICKIITYGDDHILSVHPNFAIMHTPFEIKQCIESMGHGYTDAFKNSIVETTPWQDLDEVAFLKRTFVKHESENYYYAPLELRSIREMVNWIHKSPSDVDATLLNCEGAFRELCHHDRRIFNEYSDTISSALAEHGISIKKLNYHLMRWQMRRGQFDQFITNAPWV